jgi:hypothetical protein
MVRHYSEPESYYEPISRFLQKLSGQAGFLHVIKVKEEIRPWLFLSRLHIFNYETVVLTLHKELETANSLGLTAAIFLFILLFRCSGWCLLLLIF